jgi:hypothetical protein
MTGGMSRNVDLSAVDHYVYPVTRAALPEALLSWAA